MTHRDTRDADGRIHVRLTPEPPERPPALALGVLPRSPRRTRWAMLRRRAATVVLCGLAAAVVAGALTTVYALFRPQRSEGTPSTIWAPPAEAHRRPAETSAGPTGGRRRAPRRLAALVRKPVTAVPATGARRRERLEQGGEGGSSGQRSSSGHGSPNAGAPGPGGAPRAGSDDGEDRSDAGGGPVDDHGSGRAPEPTSGEHGRPEPEAPADTGSGSSGTGSSGTGSSGTGSSGTGSSGTGSSGSGSSGSGSLGSGSSGSDAEEPAPPDDGTAPSGSGSGSGSDD